MLHTMIQHSRRLPRTVPRHLRQAALPSPPALATPRWPTFARPPECAPRVGPIGRLLPGRVRAVPGRKPMPGAGDGGPAGKPTHPDETSRIQILSYPVTQRSVAPLCDSMEEALGQPCRLGERTAGWRTETQPGQDNSGATQRGQPAARCEALSAHCERPSEPCQSTPGWHGSSSWAAPQSFGTSEAAERGPTHRNMALQAR